MTLLLTQVWLRGQAIENDAICWPTPSTTAWLENKVFPQQPFVCDHIEPDFTVMDLLRSRYTQVKLRVTEEGRQLVLTYIYLRCLKKGKNDASFLYVANMQCAVATIA